MSRKESCNRTAENSGEEDDKDEKEEQGEEKEEEDFYDCQETLKPPDAQKEEPGDCSTTPEIRKDKDEDQEGESASNRQQDDSDSEFQEQQVEFDDDYLREAEKDLTDEEKKSRQQQSLTLKEEGNRHFKASDWVKAEQTYSEALVLCPVCYSTERSVLFSNRAAARSHLGSKDQAIADCTKALELNPDYVRALLRRAELYEQTEKLDEALEDYKNVLERDPSQTCARSACIRLPQQIQERNEKLKEEMMGKLKDLGNMFLRPFGLSTQNFQVNQDQNSGSYSINFVQKPNNNNNSS